MKPVNFTIAALIAGLFSVTCTQADTQISAADTWQVKRLMQPSQADLQREDQGHIMIYDGLTDKMVRAALDQNFNRIEAMMFTGTIITDDSGEPAVDPDTGEVLIEEDGCD